MSMSASMHPPILVSPKQTARIPLGATHADVILDSRAEMAVMMDQVANSRLGYMIS